MVYPEDLVGVATLSVNEAMLEKHFNKSQLKHLHSRHYGRNEIH